MSQLIYNLGPQKDVDIKYGTNSKSLKYFDVSEHCDITKREAKEKLSINLLDLQNFGGFRKIDINSSQQIHTFTTKTEFMKKSPSFLNDLIKSILFKLVQVPDNEGNFGRLIIDGYYSSESQFRNTFIIVHSPSIISTNTEHTRPNKLVMLKVKIRVFIGPLITTNELYSSYKNLLDFMPINEKEALYYSQRHRPYEIYTNFNQNLNFLSKEADKKSIEAIFQGIPYCLTTVNTYLHDTSLFSGAPTITQYKASLYWIISDSYFSSALSPLYRLKMCLTNSNTIDDDDKSNFIPPFTPEVINSLIDNGHFDVNPPTILDFHSYRVPLSNYLIDCYNTSTVTSNTCVGY